MRTTRADVAKLAGVSTATVSYVLNNKGNISEETRKKVLEAVSALSYKPDMIARSMAANETKQLGIVLENLSNPFYGDIVHGFENAANEKGYFVNICTGYNKLDEYFDNFISRRLDGVFVAAIPHHFQMENLYQLVEKGVKVIVSGNTEANLKKVSSIENDCFEGVTASMSHLYELGHRHIAYISGISRHHKFDVRIAGYLKAVEKFTLGLGDSLLFDGAPPYTTDITDGCRLTEKLIESGKHFSAIVCLNDLMAIGAIKTCQQHGLKVPEDISVVGFDDIPFASVWTPAITTLSFQKQLFGAKAFELLHSNIKNGNTGFYMNRLQLVIRQSTAHLSV
jgi:DNA-binding LacI/PurR family transcriptional regulator